MERMTPSEIFNAATIAIDEGQFDSVEQACNWVSIVESYAKRLHTLYTRACNQSLTERETRAITHAETEIRGLFKDHRLGLYLQSDPRGNPVGILTPKTGKYNTMGGAEAGWRL